MFPRAGAAGLSACAVQPQWYGTWRCEREGCEGWEARWEGQRAQASGTGQRSQGRPGTRPAWAPGSGDAPDPGGRAAGSRDHRVLSRLPGGMGRASASSSGHLRLTDRGRSSNDCLAA